MTELTRTLKHALSQFQFLSSEQWESKPHENKWSKKEILGHLIDSALNNIQRFTEVQYLEKPYKVRPYKQDDLVNANYYQNKPTQEIINLWLELNRHIAFLMDRQNQQTLAYEIYVPEGQQKDLKWLMDDYVNHLKHHLNVILKA